MIRVKESTMHSRFSRIVIAAALACAALLLVSVVAGMPPAAQKKLASFDPQVNALLAKMTLDEKIGQMTQAEQDALKSLDEIDTYKLGSILSGGSSDPKAGNTLADWTEMYDRLQARAVKTRLGIPILYGVDAVHGHNNVIGAVVFPHNVGLGCTRNPSLVEKISRITAKEIRATGIQWTFAPCVAVVRDERWGRTYESFSEDPDLVKVLGEAAVRGLQGPNLADPLSVLACAKHYLGDGGTTLGTGLPRGGGNRFPFDQGDTRVSEADLRRLHLPGYITAVRAGVGTVMPSYSSWNGEKVSGSKRLMTDLLKNELGFEGFVISDYNAIDQLPGDWKSDVETSINAGMDMVMVPAKFREFFTTLKALVDERKVPESRIDDAVRRILRVKFAMGLMDKSRNQLADRTLHKSFGSAEHRAVGREAVRQSLVLLKNDRKTLPLAKNSARIHVGGKNADDIGNQCGGWTIAWQGQSGPAVPGTTVLAAIRKAVSPSTTVTFSKDGTGADGATVGVVVIGEKPYAEMTGDRMDLSLDKEDVAAVTNMKKAGIPVVAVLISGRPMIINDVLGQADAFIAAWLPGTEGDGVADVLFGAYKPTGKLSFSWPRSNDQLPINVGDVKYDPLFKYGYGLSY